MSLRVWSELVESRQVDELRKKKKLHLLFRITVLIISYHPSLVYRNAIRCSLGDQ